MCLVLRDHPLIHQVYLVAEDDYWRVRILHLVNALYPVVYRFIRLLICQVEAEDNSVRLTVKLVGDVLELFLTCRVPDLHLALYIVLLVEVLR